MERTQWEFSIFLTEEDAIKLFDTNIHISCLASVDQINCKLQLICNSREDPDNIIPYVNASTDKVSAPKEMQFGACLACLLQKIWEADSADEPVWITKWDISDAFHRCNVRLSDIGKFTYIMTPSCPNPLYSSA